MPCQWNAIYTLGARRTDVLLQWVRLVATQQTTRGCDRVRCNLRPTGYVRILRAVHGTRWQKTDTVCIFSALRDALI
jgi:hypothetical protein